MLLRYRWMRRIVMIFVAASLILVSCQASDPSMGDMIETGKTPEETKEIGGMDAVEITQDTAELTVTESPEKPTKTILEETTPADTQTEESMSNPLPPDPIVQNFQASDGVELRGKFYPAAKIDAPLLVLFHWAPGDQEDWRVIASWLQNRGLEPEFPESGPPWLDSSWFPAVPKGVSFNVFTFTFRGCDGGCQRFDREGWLLDVEAVMSHVTGLENVDLSLVGTMGASIGADGAAYGCHYYNSEVGGCQGALSLSPGGYLTLPYPDEVTTLEQESPPKPAWCIYGSADAESANACETASGGNYQAIAYADGAHGLAMIEPGRDPDPLHLMLQFLNYISVCQPCS